jgi:signal transduction histidine kinase/phage shock protein PspC (stress-responsive transcriptional regulator)
MSTHRGVQPLLLRRDPAGRWLGGVCTGIARRYGVDVTLVRLAFVVSTAAGGVGLALYALAWLVIPAGDAPSSIRRRLPSGRAAVEVALGTGLLLLSVLLTFRALGVWFSDAIVWPLVLVASGGALIWRGSMGDRDAATGRTPSRAGGADGGPAAEPGEATIGQPVEARGRGGAAPSERLGASRSGAGAAPSERLRAPRSEASAGVERHRAPLVEQLREGVRGLGTEAGAHLPAPPTAAAISRVGVGIALVIAAGFAFLQATGALSAARDVLLSVIAVVVVLGVIFAPWIVRLVRSLAAERAQRIRSQERAEMGAHLHDSVLQTLALVQRRGADPQEVAALARRQERELRAWLAGRPAPGQAARLAPALEAAAADVEERHGVPVEVVVVGDRDLDPAVEAVVGAAREAMTNAAKFGAGSPVDVYAESADSRVQVFVRDRGPGFDPRAIPGDRRGVRESIVGRMERHGGRATITSAPGAGTEVELVLEVRP